MLTALPKDTPHNNVLVEVLEDWFDEYAPLLDAVAPLGHRVVV